MNNSKIESNDVSISSSNRINYISLLPVELQLEIAVNFDRYRDLIQFINTFNISEDPKNYLFLLNINFPILYNKIKTIESIDNANYDKFYKRYYGTLIGNGEINELVARINFYTDYPVLYPKINKYLGTDLFMILTKLYYFSDPVKVKRSILVDYISTGNIEGHTNISPTRRFVTAVKIIPYGNVDNSHYKIIIFLYFSDIGPLGLNFSIDKYIEHLYGDVYKDRYLKNIIVD